MSDVYLETSQATSQLFTNRYSTSFSLASRLFPKSVRIHIYAIYGLMRVADEVVDSYRGVETAVLLTALEQETYAALVRWYSPNPLIHAFQATASKYAIDKTLIQPFFASMQVDVLSHSFTKVAYETYIHGSAEVVGLMCLRVFCKGDARRYDTLAAGAARLGAAYQKINFLRDLHEDNVTLGRYYFPVDSYKTFDERTKHLIIEDIKHDLAVAVPAIGLLPKPVRRAVWASYRYYRALLTKLERTPAYIIKNKRLRITNAQKVLLLVVPNTRSARV
jgi:phytoene synthase